MKNQIDRNYKHPRQTSKINMERNTYMERLLENKTAIITGGSRGIGRAIALSFAKEGANIVFTYVSNDEAAKETVELITQIKQKSKNTGADSHAALALKGDGRSSDFAQLAVKNAVESFGNVDILVNNAGITKDGLLLRMKKEDFTDVVDRQLGDDRQLSSINPDTLFFDIGTLAQKKVPVHHQLNITTEKEYMLKDSIALTPDSITISGTQAAIDEVTYVMGAPQTLVNLANPAEGNFSLLPIKSINFSDEQIHYQLNIIRYTEGVIKIPVAVRYLPSDVTITLLPSEVELRYRIAISDFSLVDTAQFTASVSYKDATDNNDRTLAVKVTHKPKEVLSVHLTPPFVEYIIRKK